MTLDRRDDRLAQLHAGRTHGTVAVERDPVDPLAAGFGHRLQIGARAEGAVRAGEHRDREVVVGVEARERVDQRVGGRAVDRVAGFGPVDGDDRDRTLDVVVHCHASPSLTGSQ